MFKRNVIILNYNNGFERSRSSKTYYITYDDKSYYRTYYNYERYRRNDRIIYLSSDKRYYRNDRYIDYDNEYNKNYRYDKKQRYNYYDYGYSSRKTNYHAEVWELKKSSNCPYGWSCTNANRIYL